jgi:hypothetical protein
VTGGTVPYAVGDWIEHDALGERRESIVLERLADIKEDGGADGFYSFTVHPRRMASWGYDREVRAVLRRADPAEIEEYQVRCERWLNDEREARGSGGKC